MLGTTYSKVARLEWLPATQAATMNDGLILEKLDELVAATKVAAIPVGERWLGAAGVGVLLSYTAQYVRETLAPRPDFPKPLREGNPRWLGSEIQEWAIAQRDRRKGRPRKEVL